MDKKYCVKDTEGAFFTFGYKDEVNLEKSKDDKSILKVDKDNKKIYLGSKYNAKKDIEDIRDKVKTTEDSKEVFIFGLGSGEYIEYLMDLDEISKKIYIIEPNINAIKLYLGNREFSPKDYNIELIIYDEKLLLDYEEDFYLKGIGEPLLIIHPGYSKIYEMEILKFNRSITKAYTKCTVENNTIIHHSANWIKNTICNLENISSSYYISDFKDKFKGKPAIVVSAGPSLDENLDKIKKEKDKFIIICGIRTLKPLLDTGVHPDFLVIIDGGEIVYKMFSAIDSELLKNTTMVYSELVSQKVVKAFKGKKIFHTRNEFIINSIKKEGIIIDTGGSVAHSCTNLAINLGCNTISFIGQDLAYVNGEFHSKTSSNKNVIKENTYDENAIIGNNKGIYVKSVNKGEVKTSFVLDMFRKQLETIIYENNNIKFVNCSSAGAMIEGTIVKTLDEFSKELKVFDKEINYSKVNRIKNENNLLELLKNLEINAVNIKESCEKSLKILRSKMVHSNGGLYLSELKDKIYAIRNGKMPIFLLDIAIIMAFSKVKKIEVENKDEALYKAIIKEMDNILEFFKVYNLKR